MYVLPAYYDVTYHIVENFDVVTLPPPPVLRKKCKIISDTIEPLYPPPSETIRIINNYQPQQTIRTSILTPVINERTRFFGTNCNCNCINIPCFHFQNHHHHHRYHQRRGCYPVTRITRYWEKCSCKSKRPNQACGCEKKEYDLKSVGSESCSGSV